MKSAKILSYLLIIFLGGSSALLCAQIQIEPKDLFFKPRNEAENKLYQAGLQHYWQMYGCENEIQPQDYKGYILFADPYHYGLKKTSFLLGTDCSHLVHRLYEHWGLVYPHAKTRHLIHLAEMKNSSLTSQEYWRKTLSSGSVLDMPLERWKELAEKFERIPSKLSSIEIGDLIVLPRKKGIYGLHGHVGLVVDTRPLVLFHAKNRSSGIVREEYDLSNKEYFVLRWHEKIDFNGLSFKP